MEVGRQCPDSLKFLERLIECLWRGANTPFELFVGPDLTIPCVCQYPNGNVTKPSQPLNLWVESHQQKVGVPRSHRKAGRDPGVGGLSLNPRGGPGA